MRIILLMIFVALFVGPSFADELDEMSARRLAASADGRQIAVAGSDRIVRVWSTEKLQLTHTLKLDDPGASVAFSPDGTIVYGGTKGHRDEKTQAYHSNVHAWRLSKLSDDPLWRRRLIGTCDALVISPEASWLASFGCYGNIHFIDTSDGAIKRVWLESGNGFGDAAVAPSGKTLITAGQYFTFWDLSLEPLPMMTVDLSTKVTAEQCKRFVRGTLGPSATTVAISRDGTLAIAVGAFVNQRGYAHDLVAFDMATGESKGILAKGVDGIRCAAISPDGDTLALGFDANKVELWSIRERNLRSTITLDAGVIVRSLDFLAEGKQLALAGRNGSRVEIRDAASGLLVRQLWPEE